MSESDKLEKIDEVSSSQENEDRDGSSATKTEPWKRESMWVRAYAALKLSALPRKNFRQTDRITDYLVTLSFASLILLVFAPIGSFKPTITLIFDALCISTLLYFIINRLGAISTIEQRKAVLVWDIILGAFMLGILLTLNMAILLTQLGPIFK